MNGFLLAVFSSCGHSQAARAKVDYLDPRILIRYARPGNLFRREFIHRLLGNVGGKTVLDVGCGGGQDALVLSKLGAHVTGIDLSAGAISVARDGHAGSGISRPVPDAPPRIERQLLATVGRYPR